jgi:pyruvate dehydrogenase E2 component (dihydrolipoamide acetyltransferase)
MPEYIVMPKLGLTMKYGTVTKWLKNEGDIIKKGEPIVEIATDKITNVVEAYCSGILAKILVKENENANVGDPIGVVVKEGEDFRENNIAQVEKSSNEISKIVQERKIKASPIAKKLAAEYNLELGLVTATGPGGRITKEDVENYIKAQKKERIDTVEKKDHSFLKTEKEMRRIKLSGVRKVIAERMVQSVREIPHVTEHIKVVVDKLYNLKDELSNSLNIKLTFTDIISKLVVKAIQEFPLINSTLKDDEIIYLDNINLGFAVATDNGLVVPVVKNAGNISFIELVNTIKELTLKARDSRLTLEDLEGGTFTITNLGMYGIDSFTPIIFPGQTAILGVNTINEELCYKDEKITTERVLKLSLSFDHRVIDGAEAAKFLGIVKSNFENPLKYFIN